MPEGQSDIEIKTIKPGSTKLSGLVKIRLADNLGEGAEGTVRRARVTLSRNDNVRSTELAFKSSHDRELTNEHVLINYNNAKNAGLPVPTTFRLTEDRKDILMTDLTDKGKNIVLSTSDLILEKKTIKELYQDRPGQINLFANAQQLTSETTGQRFRELAEKGGEARLLIPADAWFIVINPDGSYNFVVGDFGYIPKFEYFQEKRMEEISLKNLNIVKDILSTLQDYRTDPVKAVQKLEGFKLDLGR